MSGATDFRKVLTDEDIAAMNARTQQRREAAIAALGARWLGYVAPKQPAAAAANVKTIHRRTK